MIKQNLQYVLWQNWTSNQNNWFVYIYIYTAKCEGRIPFSPIKCWHLRPMSMVFPQTRNNCVYSVWPTSLGLCIISFIKHIRFFMIKQRSDALVCSLYFRGFWMFVCSDSFRTQQANFSDRQQFKPKFHIYINYMIVHLNKK